MKKALSIVLTFALLLSILPMGLFSIPASAENTAGQCENSALTVHSSKVVDIENNETGTNTHTHTHQIKNIWSFDKTHHWEKCYTCGDETTKQTHIFSGDSDATCDTCGYTRLLETITSQEHLSTVPSGYKGIYTYNDLLSINNNPSDKYILMSDIDVSQHTASVIINKEFTGVFNGNGYSIKNFTYDTAVEKEMVLAIGVFIKNTGTICNLTIKNFSSVVSLQNKKTSSFIGLIAADNSGIIRNCSVLDCSAFCSGNDSIAIGGIAASNTSNGSIEYCKVTSSNYEWFLGASTNSYTSGSSLYSGGVCGINEGNIRACYTDLYISVGSGEISMIGGISAANGGTISDCYSTGTMIFDLSTTSFGCIVGYNYENGRIENTFSNGYCTQANNSNYRVRCIARTNTGTIQNSYVKSDFLATANCQYGTHCTSAQFSQQSTFIGFDFNMVWSMGSSAPYLNPYNASNCIEGNAHSGGFNCCSAPKICDICGTIYAETGDHIYSQLHTLEDPTCSSTGLGVKICSYCGDEVIEEISTTNHIFSNSEDLFCDNCGYERPPYTPGDIDGEAGVSDADARYLLMYTFFPEDYPVDQSCDFNGDNSADDNDARYLLMHTFFPEDYPLASNNWNDGWDDDEWDDNNYSKYYEDEFFTVLISNGEAEIVDFNENYVGNLEIPQTINGYPVVSIGGFAFYYCTNLTSVTIPNSVTCIGDEAFFNCTNLTSVTIPSSVTIIGNEAFGFCYNLTSISISDGVTSIGDYAFTHCNFTRITIPNSVNSIGKEAFFRCTNLINVTIPSSVAIIGEGAFSGCTNLTGIWVDDENCYYSSDEKGMLFNKNKTILINAPCAIFGSYTIPNSVTSINNKAFYNCQLNRITIPSSVISIGDEAFAGSGLYNITIPNSVTSIGERAFANCSNITSVTLSNSVISIGERAFEYCYALKTVYFRSEAQKEKFKDYFDSSVQLIVQ